MGLGFGELEDFGRINRMELGFCEWLDIGRIMKFIDNGKSVLLFFDVSLWGLHFQC